MKRTLIAFVPTAALVLLMAGCGPSEAFIIKQEGTWNIVSEQTLRYEDGNFVSDITRTDSLGSYQFEKSGGGTYIDASGGTVPITWSIDKGDDSMVIYSATRPFVNAAIDNTSPDDITLKWNVTFGEFAVLVRNENTTKMKRAN